MREDRLDDPDGAAKRLLLMSICAPLWLVDFAVQLGGTSKPALRARSKVTIAANALACSLL